MTTARSAVTTHVDSVNHSGGNDREEAQPLLARRPPTASPLRLAPLLGICVLERCAFYQYMAESVDTGTGGAASYCGVLGDNFTRMQGLDASWPDQLLRSTAYLLPAVGGALADSWFGCVPVLRFASVLYVFGAWLLSMAVYLPAMLQPNPFCSTAVKIIYQSTLSLASGLARPCLLTLVYEAGRPLMGPLELNQLYYLGEAVGQVMGSGLAYQSNFAQVPLTAGCVAAALLMVTLSAVASGPERRGWQPEQFYILGRHRVKRLMLVSLPVILLTTMNVFGCFTLNSRGLAYFHGNLTASGKALTQMDFLTDSDLMLLIYSAALLVFMLGLALLTRAVPAVRSHSARICIGLVLAAVSQFCAFCVYKVGPAAAEPGQSLTAYMAVFGFLNCLVAASEAATFSTMNELALLIAPGEIRAYTVGLVYSLWGTGFLFSLLVQWLSYGVSALNDAGVFFSTTLPWVCLALGCIMVAATAHFLKFAPKAIKWLLDIEARARRLEFDRTAETMEPPKVSG